MHRSLRLTLNRLTNIAEKCAVAMCCFGLCLKMCAFFVQCKMISSDDNALSSASKPYISFLSLPASSNNMEKFNDSNLAKNAISYTKEPQNNQMSYSKKNPPLSNDLKLHNWQTYLRNFLYVIEQIKLMSACVCLSVFCYR